MTPYQASGPSPGREIFKNTTGTGVPSTATAADVGPLTAVGSDGALIDHLLASYALSTPRGPLALTGNFSGSNTSTNVVAADALGVVACTTGTTTGVRASTPIRSRFAWVVGRSR